MPTPSRFAQLAARRVLVLDGAMGTSIFARDLSVERDYCGCENCTDILVRTRPDVIQEIHESFLLAGADCVETDSFGANKLVLGEFDLTPETRSLNKMAAEVARAACDKHSTSDKPRFVLGSMGPGTKLITLGNTHWDELFDSYREQARGLLDGGVDAFIIETCQDVLQVKCAINACLAALAERGLDHTHVPIMVSITIETTGTMLVGSSIEAAASVISQYPVMSLGLNCATGPAEMADHVAYLGKHWGAKGDALVSVVPNAGLPVLLNGRTEYPLRPEPFAEAMLKFVETSGASLVGGCCGTTPEHIRLLAQAVGGRDLARAGQSPGPRAVLLPPKQAPAPSVTSLYGATDLRQDNSLLIIGERMNASGSKKFKQLLEAEDFDGIVSLAREQVRHDSAHVLDLNVDYAGRDNARDMAEVVKRVVRQVDAPLMLDSTQLKTLEAGLKHAPGKCIINSGNFEDGEHKFDEVCRLATTYGAALVVGSIDEDKEASMARTAQRKLAIAQRAFERATTVHKMDPADLMFDPLVLPISTGMASDRRSGLETIEGVRAISRALPACQTTVGLSNVSFGLRPQARIVLNSAFLHELREAGLTSAILHFSKILPKNKIPADQWQAALDLIYDRRATSAGGTGLPAGVTDEKFDPLSRFVELFKDEQAGAGVKKEKKTLTLEERLQAHIVDGEKEGLAQTLDQAREKYAPLAIINDHLLAGMKTVGDLFGSGQMQLPFVLQSAEVMKMAVALLQPHMEKLDGQTKGSIVLATVKGDVHDIGKNLVDIILSNNGYTVHNIGIKQPIADIVKAWRDTRADAIGMSGLLVKSVTVMEENLHEMNALGVGVPVLLGGAALTRHYCEGHLRGLYKGEVFYGKDAFEGLRTMDMIKAGQTGVLAAEITERTGKRTQAEETIARSKAQSARKIEAFEAAKSAGAVAVIERSDVRADVPVPRAPFWGTRAITGIDLDQVYPFINKVALYRGQWQFKQGAMTDEEFEHQLEDTVGPIFQRLKERCRAERILQPAVVYGYFPCSSAGNDLIIYHPDDHDREIERFTFPRQDSRKRLCISDFFRPESSAERDVIAMHCVTVGHQATVAAQELYKANAYTEYLYLHGMGVETAEALAEMWHKRIRQELGIGADDSPRVRDLFTQKYRGSRYSFGYPACPDMSDQDKLFRLLDPARIGCHLTENWQIDPEQSTSAIIVHHPEAKYFNV
jgi:5-methyltetrahydrofolate--homocysteine methyltransferase